MRFSFARESSSAADVSRARSSELSDRDLETRREVLLARADVEPDLAGVGVLGEVAVDRVRHPTLLADLLEEPRRRRAAEDRIEDRRREAAFIRAVDPRRAEADVVLLGVLPLEAEAGPGEPAQRPACERPPPAGTPSPRLAEQRDEVARAAGSPPPRGRRVGRHTRGGGRPRAHGSTRSRSRPHARSPAARADARRTRPRRRCRARGRAACPRPSRSLRARPPARSRRPRTQAEDHVRHHVERGLEAVVRDARVDHRRLARGGGVQLAAELVEDLGDLLRACTATSP